MTNIELNNGIIIFYSPKSGQKLSKLPSVFAALTLNCTNCPARPQNREQSIHFNDDNSASLRCGGIESPDKLCQSGRVTLVTDVYI